MVLLAGGPWPLVNEEDDCSSCPPNKAGICGPAEARRHYYTLDNGYVCYRDCAWHPRLQAPISTTVQICTDCPDNPETVACYQDVAGMTQQQACLYLQRFPHDPVRYSDIGLTNWCRDCVVIHEYTHLWKDWVEERMVPAIDSFADYLDRIGIPIDCYDSTTLNCQTVVTPSKKAQLDDLWEAIIEMAILEWELDPDPEGDAEAAELACYQQIVNTLKARCQGN